jgi:hypothetical protein
MIIQMSLNGTSKLERKQNIYELDNWSFFRQDYYKADGGSAFQKCFIALVIELWALLKELHQAFWHIVNSDDLY